MTNDGRYWFPAKRYGWGWGLPITWQGWVFFIGWLVIAVAISLLLRRHPLAALACLMAMSALFGLVAWWKGEPPHWRWGDKP